MIKPRVQPLAPLLSFRQMLEQQAACEPMLPALLGGEPHQARDLLGLREIALRRVAEVLSLERHDALIALVRQRLVEGDREIAIAEQLLEARLGARLRQPLRIVADIAAQSAAEIVADHEVDDPALRLRLKRELALRLLEQ